MPKRSKAVIDASAFLALLNVEPGAETVAEYLPGSYMSSANLAEVVGKLAESGMPESAIKKALSGLGVVVVEVGEHLAWRAGLMKPGSRKTGLSLADLACLALAEEKSLPAVTADRSWSNAGSSANVVLIR